MLLQPILSAHKRGRTLSQIGDITTTPSGKRVLLFPLHQLFVVYVTWF
jgi:hypothetical protein